MPGEPFLLETLMLAAWMSNDMPTCRRASTEFIGLLPAHPLGHYVAGLVAAEDGRWTTAERELLSARDLGWDAADIQRVLDLGIARHAWMERLRGWALWSSLLWVAAGVALLALGALLSRGTVAAVRSHEATGNFEAAPTELRARALYRAVIALTSIYYYASIPVLVIITAGAAAGIVWLFLSVGRVPVKLMLFVLAAALYTLVAVVRSAFARVRDEDPGRPLSREEAPALWELADDVAARVNTRPVDAVYVTPGTGLGVMERGSATKRIRGLGRRCLVLGLGALEGMTQSQFGAILAHEYGHFAGRDTAGGDLARHVQVSMMRMAQGLAENGQASWHNPAWLFVNAFHRLFVRVTHGASRLQEILADRTAVATCGTEAFASGLLHVIRRSIAFDWQVNDEVRRAAKEGRAVGNLYALALPEKDDPEARIDQRVQEILDQPPSPYDTHPVVTDRIDLAMRMNVGAAGPGGQSPAWGLIPNAAGLQEEMTALVRANVEQMSQRRHLRNRRRSER